MFVCIHVCMAGWPYKRVAAVGYRTIFLCVPIKNKILSFYLLSCTFVWQWRSTGGLLTHRALNTDNT